MNIQHESRSDLWYTPALVLTRAKRVLGPIDLDPASDDFGNLRVGAKEYFTREQDGLKQNWNGPAPRTIFLNPPGGKLGNQSLAALFWVKLMELHANAGLSHAIFMAFSLEQLQTTQDKGVPSIGVYPLCVPSSRLRFDKPDGSTGDAPSHSNCIVYVPGTIDRSKFFVKEFQGLGCVLNAVGWL